MPGLAYSLRAAPVRIRELEQSGASWKTRALAADGEVSVRGAFGEDSWEEPARQFLARRVADYAAAFHAAGRSCRLPMFVPAAPRPAAAASAGSCRVSSLSLFLKSRLSKLQLLRRGNLKVHTGPVRQGNKAMITSRVTGGSCLRNARMARCVPETDRGMRR
jgi:hypothetical protein